jgi:hypothetical protein
MTRKFSELIKGNSFAGGKNNRNGFRNHPKRSLPEGGFSMYWGESFRPDVTAWAVLALKAGQEDQKVSTSACQKLAQCQNPDGRISVIDGLL